MNPVRLQQETKLSFSELREQLDSDKLKKQEESRSSAPAPKLKSNCLKTADEMEIDFWKEMMMGVGGIQELRNNRDGYLNTNPERIDSGFMEENY